MADLKSGNKVLYPPGVTPPSGTQQDEQSVDQTSYVYENAVQALKNANVGDIVPWSGSYYKVEVDISGNIFYRHLDSNKNPLTDIAYFDEDGELKLKYDNDEYQIRTSMIGPYGNSVTVIIIGNQYYDEMGTPLNGIYDMYRYENGVLVGMADTDFGDYSLSLDISFGTPTTITIGGEKYTVQPIYDKDTGVFLGYRNIGEGFDDNTYYDEVMEPKGILDPSKGTATITLSLQEPPIADRASWAYDPETNTWYCQRQQSQCIGPNNEMTKDPIPDDEIPEDWKNHYEYYQAKIEWTDRFKEEFNNRMSDVRKKNWIRLGKALFQLRAGSLKIEELVEKHILGKDVALFNADEWWQDLGTDNMFAYTLIGYEYYFCRLWRGPSPYFVETAPGRYGNNVPGTNNIMYVLGERTEALEHVKNTGCSDFNGADGPKWFYDAARDKILGYIYKFSFRITNPYSASEIDEMSDDLKSQKGIEKNGSIFYKIKFRGKACSNQNLKDEYEIPESEYDIVGRQLIPGEIFEKTISVYNKAFIDSICIVFDSWKYDSIHTEFPPGCEPQENGLGTIVVTNYTSSGYPIIPTLPKNGEEEEIETTPGGPGSGSESDCFFNC